MKKKYFTQKLFLLFLFLLNSCIGGKQTELIPAVITYDFLRNIKNIVPVAILGSGPAGLSAAVYAARANKYTVVFHGNKPGGLLTETTWVENWPGTERILGPDIIKELQKQAETFGAHFIHDTVESVDFSTWPFVINTEEGHTLNALSVIIATGAAPRYLGVKGEDEYWGMGVTTCAVCDAPFYKNKNVVVIGGGDSAAEEAMQLSSYAQQVTILVRKDHMRAAAHMQDLLKGFDNITIEYNKVVKEILGNGDTVTAISLYDTKKKIYQNRNIDGVFLAIGHEPNTKLFKNTITTDAHGYIILKGRGQETNITGIFAAGDVEDHTYRQAGVAAGSGIKAALDADIFLNNHGFTDQLAHKIEDQLFLPDMQRAHTLLLQPTTIQEFKSILKDASVPVIVDFYAEYCPSCMQMLPVFESIARKYADQALFVKVDAEHAVEILREYEIVKVPSLLIFKGNQLVERYGTVMDRAELRAVVKSVL